MCYSKLSTSIHFIFLLLVSNPKWRLGPYDFALGLSLQSHACLQYPESIGSYRCPCLPAQQCIAALSQSSQPLPIMPACRVMHSCSIQGGELLPMLACRVMPWLHWLKAASCSPCLLPQSANALPHRPPCTPSTLPAYAAAQCHG